MSFINTNLNSLAAQRQLSLGATSLGVAMQRLSSGMRINSAKDDAAGLAIAERFTTQIKGTEQAARNTNDAISLAQTAEGALGSISNNLQRIRELAVQSANSTNSAADRVALQAEAAQLVGETDRIASQTEFNGSKLLDGSFNAQQFQLGANRQQTVTLPSLGNFGAAVLGTYNGFKSQWIGHPTYGAASALTVTLNGPGTTFNLGTVATDGKAIVDAVNNAGIDGLTAESVNHSVSTGISTVGATNGVATVTINGVAMQVALTAGNGGGLARHAAIISAINANSAATGVTASATNGFLGVSLATLDSRTIDIAYSAGTAIGSDESDFGLMVGQYTGLVSLTYKAPSGSAVTSVTVVGAGLASATKTVMPQGTALSQLDISSVSGANSAIDSLDAALNTVNSARATMGAVQNRFQSAIANLQTTSENMSAARSRIQDADFAQETANLSRAQILQQASTAMVAQANQSPQGVLALLK